MDPALLSKMRPTKSAQPNCLSYRDGNGVQRQIYLPQGTMRTAWDHLENERWDELAKFAPYTNQGYSEEDYTPIVYDDENGKTGDMTATKSYAEKHRL